MAKATKRGRGLQASPVRALHKHDKDWTAFEQRPRKSHKGRGQTRAARPGRQHDIKPPSDKGSRKSKQAQHQAAFHTEILIDAVKAPVVPARRQDGQVAPQGVARQVPVQQRLCKHLLEQPGAGEHSEHLGQEGRLRLAGLCPASKVQKGQPSLFSSPPKRTRPPKLGPQDVQNLGHQQKGLLQPPVRFVPCPRTPKRRRGEWTESSPIRLKD